MANRRPSEDRMCELASRADRDLRRRLHQANHLAELLAARGWPTSTMGRPPGAAISDDPDDQVALTSVERAVAHPTPHDDLAERWAAVQRRWWDVTLEMLALMGTITAVGSDDDPIPAGSGECQACHDFVRSDGNRPDHRIRGGLCDACRKAKSRLGIVDRDDFIARRRADLAERKVGA